MEKYDEQKRRSRFFELHISKLLKTISPDSGITANAKQQLNSAICNISKIVCDTTFKLIVIGSKKTIAYKDIEKSIKFIFPMTMSDTLIDKCIHSVNTFTSSQQDKYVSRQDKSGLIFPPCIAEKFLRVYNVMVTKSSPIFLACLLENVCRNILENCENDKVRLTIRDLELAVRKNKDLNILFENCKISFLGGGVVPEIHEELLVKKIKKRKKQCEELLLDNKKIHRYRPGTVCIRQIKKLQKTSNCLTFAKIPFEKIVRSKILKYNPDLKFSKDIFIVIQYYIEQFLINFLRDCNTTAIHAGRVKLIPTDISFVNNIQKLNML